MSGDVCTFLFRNAGCKHAYIHRQEWETRKLTGRWQVTRTQTFALRPPGSVRRPFLFGWSDSQRGPSTTLRCRRKCGQGLTVSLLIPLILNTDPYSCPPRCSVFSCAEPPGWLSVGVRRWAAQKGGVSADPVPYRPSIVWLFSAPTCTHATGSISHI